MRVELAELTPGNWKRCARLKVAEEQEDNVSTNVFVIAEAGVMEGYTPLAIFAGGEVVGMLVLIQSSPETIVIHHVMVGAEFQGEGYGRAAVKAAIERAASDPRARNVVLSYWPGNPAVKLYESLGFRHTGELWGEEPVMSLNIGDQSPDVNG